MSLKILITGATRGLGYFLTRDFLLAGHTVFTLNLDSRAEMLTALQQEYPHRLFLHPADVRNPGQVQAAFSEISRFTSALDIIVNNAGVHLEAAKINNPEELDFEKVKETIDTNAIGPLRIINTFLGLLRLGRKKLIANISSEAGSIAASTRTGEFGYCMSKAALNMAAKILQNKLKSEAIKVLAIHPGWFSSDMGGPHAPLTPAEAAASVSKLILKEWQLEGPVYMDASGNKLDW